MKLIDHKKPPCAKCSYKLGLIKTLVNPCPQCMENDYQTFEVQRELLSFPKCEQPEKPMMKR